MTPADLRVLLCDNHLLVVEKPACVPTVPDASGDASLLDVAREWLRERFDKPGNVFLGVVQRLDRPVSGVLCFARTSKAARRLTDGLRERRVSKAYWGVVARPPREPAGKLEQWLDKDRERNRVTVHERGHPGARRALTAWTLVEQGAPGALLDLRPITGRSHQLRVAAATLGSPLLGDLKYGARTALADKSIALHARRLELDHPTRGVRLCFDVPPPASEWWSFDACAAARARGALASELAPGTPEGGAAERPDEPARTTRLLNRLGAGDRSVEQEILDLTYAQLQRLAEQSMRGRAGHTLQPTALVHEAWLRLVSGAELQFDGRAQFYALASRVMRSVLVDHHRARSREKRGGDRERLSLTLHEPVTAGSNVDVLALEEALERLEQVDPELCRVVEMRFFAGLGHPEIAQATGLALRTVERRWRQARAWLQAELGSEDD